QGSMMLIVSLIDPQDARILLALDDDPDATTLGLARSLGIARNTIHARLRRLAGTALRSFARRIDPAALGYPLVAFVSLSISQSEGAAAAEGLMALAEVVEMHATTGDADVLAKVVARDTAHLYEVTTAMLQVPGVQRSSTTISLAEHLPYRVRPLLVRAAQGGQPPYELGRRPAARGQRPFVP
ncbi:MAG TPA: Lrp/AsnC family transcriptional regulator, partial [Propionibacteriaceae bacterium]|nr:Lrp/AsnC family transcriptional regulator [Propionibacteriaceae bacterium]